MPGKMWTKPERDALKAAFSEHGPDKKELVRAVPSRSAVACLQQLVHLGRLEPTRRIRYWTPEEVTRLRKYWTELGTAPGGAKARAIGAEMGRPKSSILQKARELGLQSVGEPPRWTPEDLAYVRTNYRKKSLATLVRKLKRTAAAIRRAARDLFQGVPRPRAHWSSKEDATLRLYWADSGVRTLRDKLPGRSWGAIRHRACKELGLGADRMQGFSSLAQIKRRYEIGSYKTLHKVLDLAGLQVRQGWRNAGWVQVDEAEDAAIHAALAKTRLGRCSSSKTCRT